MPSLEPQGYIERCGTSSTETCSQVFTLQTCHNAFSLFAPSGPGHFRDSPLSPRRSGATSLELGGGATEKTGGVSSLGFFFLMPLFFVCFWFGLVCIHLFFWFAFIFLVL